MKDKKMKIFKIIVFILIIALFIFLTLELVPMFQKISTPEGREIVKEEVSNLGFKGLLMVVGLMFAQIFLPILPGEPVEVLGGMCFGPIGGLLVIMLGSFLSTLFIFFLVRKFGRNFIYSFVPKEKIDKIENSKIFADTQRLNIILFILFFIPGTPKDLFVYLGGLLPVNPLKFLIISTVARFPSIISSTIVGNNLIDGNWGFIVMVYALSFGISGIIIYFFMRKRKDLKGVIGKNGVFWFACTL